MRLAPPKKFCSLERQQTFFCPFKRKQNPHLGRGRKKWQGQSLNFFFWDASSPCGGHLFPHFDRMAPTWRWWWRCHHPKQKKGADVMKEETLKSMCPPTGQATRVRRFCPGPRRWKLCPALLFHFSLTDTAERPEGTPRSFRRVALVRMEAPDAGKQWVGVDWATEVFWPEMECRLWRVAAAEMKNLKIARDLVPSVSFGSNKKTYTAAAVHGELFVLFDVLAFFE